ncbi:MAG: SurA N-terminal domain-containing protein, partial [candidate division Zixibacteria bacterium]|nr:SurA N-terminal domain-containing protein [candidate division Zixibacteria bacterium]
MFELMRRFIKPGIYLTLTFFTLLIVVQWGGDFAGRSQFANPNQAVGVVNGEEVSPELFNRVYSNLFANEQAQSGPEVSETRQSQLRAEAWNTIVADMILQQAIAELGIAVSEQELFQFIRLNPPQILRNQPQFMTDSLFDYQKYIQIMSDPANAPFWAQVEQYVLPQVRSAKMQEVVTSGARVTIEEIRREFVRNNEEAKFAVVNLTMKRFTDPYPEVTPEEVREFYDNNIETYIYPERRKIDLTLFPKEISEDDWERVKLDCQQISDDIHAGSDFVQMAALYGEDATSSDSGNLGFYPVEDLDSQYVAGAIALEIGAVSDAVRSQFGWHVIKLLGIKDSLGEETESKDDITQINTAHILLQVKVSNETLDNVLDKARQFRNSAEEKGFAQAAEEMEIETLVTTPFRETDAIQYLGPDFFAREYVFKNEIGTISGIYENSSNYFVMRVKEILPEGAQKFEELQQGLEVAAQLDKAKQICRDTLQQAY